MAHIKLYIPIPSLYSYVIMTMDIDIRLLIVCLLEVEGVGQDLSDPVMSCSCIVYDWCAVDVDMERQLMKFLFASGAYVRLCMPTEMVSTLNDATEKDWDMEYEEFYNFLWAYPPLLKHNITAESCLRWYRIIPKD